MGNKVRILDVPFDKLKFEEVLSIVKGYLNEKCFHYIVTANPEIVMMAQKDRELLNIIKNSDLTVPDGIGIIWASKFLGENLPERVAGFDLVKGIFALKIPLNVFLLGGKEGVSEDAKRFIEKEYPWINVKGAQHGFFDKTSIPGIINSMEGCDLLLVALGAPRQEKWIYKYRETLPVKLAIGVGGTLDILAGRKTRAPKIFQSLGLEWFYRLIKEPWRIKRMMAIPSFVLKIAKYKIFK